MLILLPLLLTALLGWTAPAWAIITFGTSVNAASDGSASTLAAPAISTVPPSGSKTLAIICEKWESNTTLSSITGGDAVTLLTGQQHSALEPSGRCGYILDATSSASTIYTANYSAGSLYRRTVVMTFNYTGTMTLDVQSAASVEADTDLTPSSAVVTTTGTDEVCIALQADYTNQAFSGETINGVSMDGRVTLSDVDVFYKIFTGTYVGGAASLTRTTGVRWVQRLACFKATGGSPTPPAPGAGKDYWIAPAGTGLDSNQCSDVDSVETDPPTDPGVYKLTIASAQACMVSGDRLIVKAGTYTGTGYEITNPIAGSAGNPTVFMGDPAGTRPVINPIGELPTAQRGLYCSNGSACHHITVNYLDFTTAYDCVKLTQSPLTTYATFITYTNNICRNTVNTGFQQDTSKDGTYQGGHHYIAFNEFYNIGIGTPGYGPGMNTIYNPGNDSVIEHNNFHNSTNGVGIWHDATPLRNIIIRYNRFSQMGRFDIDTWEAGASSASCLHVSSSGTGGHLIYGNTCTSSGSTNAFYAMRAGTQVTSATAVSFFNNPLYNNGGANAFYCLYATPLVKNNIIYSGTTSIGGLCTASSNQTTDPSFTDAAGGNYTLAAGSTAIDTGVNVGLSFNGSPDKGAFETFGFGSASIGTTLMDVTLAMNVPGANPVLPATGQTGWTVACSGSNCGTPVVASAARVTGSDSVVRLTLSGLGGGGVCEAGQTWTVTHTGTAVTDSTLVGNVYNQPMSAFTTQPVANLCGGASPTWQLAQVAHRLYDALYANGNPVPLSAVNAANTLIPSGVPFGLVTQVDGTVANPPSIGQRLYVSRTPIATGTPSAFVPVTDDCTTALICFMGPTSDPTVLSGAVTCCLSGALTPLNGETQFTSAAVPVYDLPQNGSVVQRRMLTTAPYAPVGDIFLFKEYIQDGTAFTSYTPAGGAKITITPVGASISAPTGLHQVGTTSNTMIQLVWTPNTDVGLAGYIVFMSLTSGETGQIVKIITSASAAATNTPMEQFIGQVTTPVTTYWTVAAFDAGGQVSAKSSEVAIVRTGITPRLPRTQ